MGKIVAEISVSLDGYVAGPSPTLENPLGEGGDQLHEWVFPLKSWREPHGLPGGETGPDDDLVAESLRATGAVVMGRRMFSGGEGPWENDTNANGWWGDDPPFHKPAFVLTHHAPVLLGGGARLFDGVGPAVPRFEVTQVLESPLVTHLRYRAVRA